MWKWGRRGWPGSDLTFIFLLLAGLVMVTLFVVPFIHGAWADIKGWLKLGGCRCVTGDCPCRREPNPGFENGDGI